MPSVRYKDDHQSVIVAYWPSTGHSLATIDYTHYRVGVIQYFLKHAVTFVDADGTEKKRNIFSVMLYGSNDIIMKTGLVFLQW